MGKSSINQIILIDNITYLNEWIAKVNSGEEKDYPIIYNSDKILIYDTIIDMTSNIIPLLSCPDTTFNELKKYDINNETFNYFFRVSCKSNIIV